MKPAIKRTISFALASVLMATSASSLNAYDLRESMMGNSTPSSTWTDPRTGTTVSSFGSQTFKFKRKVNYAPWVQLKAPTSGASCNGFSFDLGFAAILDLRAIEDQLEDATQAFMWGLLVFKLSTPNLSAVFEYINKIIREMQQMLSNACQMGQMLSKQLVKNETGQEEINLLGGIDSQLFSVANSLTDTGAGQQKSLMEKYDTWVTSLDTKTNTQKAKELTEIAKPVVDTIFKTTAIHGLLNYQRKAIQRSTILDGLNKEQYFYYDNTMSLKNFTPDNSYHFINGDSDKTWESDAAHIQSVTAAMIVSYNIYGTNIIDEASVLELNKQFSIFKGSPSDVEQKKWHKLLSESVAKKPNSAPSFKINSAYIPGQNISPENIVRLIMEGDGTGSISMPNYKVISLVAPSRMNEAVPTDKEEIEKYALLVTSSVDTATPTISMDYNGLLQDSRTGIQRSINTYLRAMGKVSGITIGNDGTVTYSYTEQTIPDAPSIPLKFNLDKVAKTIAGKIYQDGGFGGSSVDFAEIIEILAQYNAYLLGEEIIEVATELGLSNLMSSDTKPDDKTIKALQEQKKAIKKVFEEKYKKFSNPTELWKMYAIVKVELDNNNGNWNMGQ